MTNYNKFFDGSYCDDDGNLIYEVSTLRNPAGVVIRSEESGRCLVITVEDMMALADRICLRCDHPHTRRITADDLDLIKRSES